MRERTVLDLTRVGNTLYVLVNSRSNTTEWWGWPISDFFYPFSFRMSAGGLEITTGPQGRHSNYLEGWTLDDYRHWLEHEVKPAVEALNEEMYGPKGSECDSENGLERDSL